MGIPIPPRGRRRPRSASSSSRPCCILPRLLGGGDGSGTDLLARQRRRVGSTTPGPTDACQTEIEQILCGANNDVQDYWDRELPVAFGAPYEVHRHGVLHAAAPTPAAARRRRRPGRSTARPTTWCTSTSTSCEQLQEQFGGHRRPRRRSTSSPTSSATTSRTSPGRTSSPPARRDREPVVDRPRAAGRLLRRRLGPRRDGPHRCGRADLIENADEMRRGDRRRRAPSATTGSSTQTQGRVDPSQWTHGSSEQRKTWFARPPATSSGDPRRAATPRSPSRA